MGLITANDFCVFSLFPNPWTLLPFWSCPSPPSSDHFSPLAFLPPFSTSTFRLIHFLFPPLPSASYVACTAAHSRPLSLHDPIPSPTLAGRAGHRHAGRGRAPVEGRVPPLELLHGALEEPVRPLQQAGALLRPVTLGEDPQVPPPCPSP